MRDDFPIKKFRKIRHRTDYIILVPATMLIEDFYIDTIVYNSEDLLLWNLWEKYWLEALNKPALPCHYYVDRTGTDYTVVKGLPDFHPSYFIEDLVQAGIVPYKYRYSIIVVIDENYNINPLTKRLCTHLAYKVIDPLLRDYGLRPERVKFIDDIMLDDWEESLKLSTLKYKLHKSKYFTMPTLEYFINKYKNF